jgi:hypothetical protein
MRLVIGYVAVLDTEDDWDATVGSHRQVVEQLLEVWLVVLVKMLSTTF